MVTKNRQFVSLVCGNPEQHVNLQHHFHQAGVSSYCTQSVGDLSIAAPEWATVVVIFPDEFSEGDVGELLRQLRRLRSRPLVLLVTADEQRFGSQIDADRRMVRAMILPKPSSAENILNAIRARARDARA